MNTERKKGWGSIFKQYSGAKHASQKDTHAAPPHTPLRLYAPLQLARFPRGALSFYLAVRGRWSCVKRLVHVVAKAWESSTVRSMSSTCFSAVWKFELADFIISTHFEMLRVSMSKESGLDAWSIFSQPHRHKRCKGAEKFFLIKRRPSGGA